MEITKILAVKDNGKVRYIAKSNKNPNKDGVIHKSYLCQLYLFPHLRDVVFQNENISIDVLEEVTAENWYDDKLKQVVDHHKNKGANLLNADWMKEGKRGYWEGKTRDENTLQRLSESKYKKILQYFPLSLISAALHYFLNLW